MGRLDGRVAIVTGAGRGIGASVARTLATQGASVVVNDLGVNVDGTGEDVSRAAQVVDEIRKAGGKAFANHDNVADHAAAENIIRTALNEFGRLDVLVNVAGILRDRMVFNMTEEEWDAVIAVHLKGTFNTSKFASIYWRTAREGDYRLINFTSESGIFGAPGQPNYAAAKAGIVGFTLSCANALGRYGVTANCISPRAATRMTGTIPQREGRNIPDPAEQERSPDNVAPAVVYLASKESGWLTGRVVLAHGYHIGLFNEPKIEAELVSAGPWDIDTACEQMERAFKSHVEGDPGIRAALGRQ
jgi:NAD(P)-dependent dehydrogenase (short-subunit alcohol dehydrogenase family)